MVYPQSASDVKHQITVQMELADLATVYEIRLMHEDLEQLYRTQLVALVLAEALPPLVVSRPTALDDRRARVPSREHAAA